MVIARIPTCCGIAPLLKAATTWPPTITLTVDQPRVAATLKSAMIEPPTQPKEKREIVMVRRPSFGPNVERKATGKIPSTLKIMMAATLSQNPRKNTPVDSAPSATVEITILAESQI